jgi:hypothetical protein
MASLLAMKIPALVLTEIHVSSVQVSIMGRGANGAICWETEKKSHSISFGMQGSIIYHYVPTVTDRDL